MHSVHYNGRLTKILILILEGILKKNFYERRDYESVDEKILSLSYVTKTTQKKTSCSNGLNVIRKSVSVVVEIDI